MSCKLTDDDRITPADPTTALLDRAEAALKRFIAHGPDDRTCSKCNEARAVIADIRKYLASSGNT